MKKMKPRSTILFGLLMVMVSGKCFNEVLHEKIYILRFILILVASSIPTLSDDHNEDNDHEKIPHPNLTITCETYNRKECKKEPCLPTKVTCPASEDKRQACFVLWGIENKTETAIIEMKGCFTFHEDCEQSECIDRKFNKTSGKNFCCCKEDSCNNQFVWIPTAVEPTTTENYQPEESIDTLAGSTKWFLALCLLISLGIFAVASKYFYHQRKQIFNEVPTSEPEISVSAKNQIIRPIDLIEIKAHGRFGTVWKAKFKSEDVAVKVFPSQDKQSWITEQEIYQLPRMNHANILHFIGAENHSFQDSKAEFWLITQYHPLGSLCDYLKSHTVTWPELCKISESMARGLMHLHEEIPGTKTEELKPAIAHRDFKSKNVLLKSDLTACVADFGLALRFTPGQPCGDVHGQVGTRRYMAPEILEGAINFNRDSFLRIDVYACGLVLWELVSRCTLAGPVPEYRLPFEAELGSHPTLEEMQDNIAAKKIRPRINEEWRSHPVSLNKTFFIIYQVSSTL